MAESFKDIIDEFKNINKETQKLVSSIGSMSDRQTAALQNIADILENDLPSPIPPSETDTTDTGELSRTNSVLSEIGNVLKGDLKSLFAPIAGIARAIPGLTTATKIGSILVKAVIKPKNNSRDSEDRQEADADREEQKTLLQTMVKGIINLNKSFLNGLKEGTRFGLGAIAGLISAPVIMLVSFFKSLGAELKFLNTLTGGRLAKLFSPIMKFFDVIKTSFARLGIGRFITSVKTFLAPITNFFKSMLKIGDTASSFSKAFGGIAKFASGFGSILGKLFLPITILMSAFDFITGFMDGYSEGGILGGLEGGLSKLFANLIGMPLDLLKSAVSWIAGVFGFSGVESALDSFSFATLITDLIGGIFDGVKGVFSFLGDLFTWPTSLGDEPFTFSGLISDAFTSAKDWFVGIFTWASEGIAGTFTSLSGFISEKFTAVKDWFVGIFSWASEGIAGTFTSLSGFISDAFTAAKDWIVGIFTWGTEGIANSDWGFMTPVKDAFAAAIAWVTGIFSWGEEGPTVKGGITKFIDIVLAPYNLAVNWLMGLFGFSTPDGEPFSIGKLVMDAITKIFDWFKGLLDFDFSALVMKIPGAETVLNFLGYGDETPELTEEEKNLESQKQRNMEIEQEKLDIQTRIAKFDAGENPYSWWSNAQEKRDEDTARLAQLNMEETPLAQLNMSDGMVIEKVISQESAAKTAALISGNITASEIERSFKQQPSQMIVNAPSTTTVMAGGGGKIALPINMNDSGSAAIAANSNY
jgi:hypothetical protein